MIASEDEKKVLDEFLEKMDADENYVPNEDELDILDKLGLLEEVCEEENIELDLSTVQNFQLNVNEYKKGLKDASYYVGFANALKSVGYPMALIHELLLVNHNKKDNGML